MAKYDYCVCGYNGRIDHLKAHIKKCKALPIISECKQKIEDLQTENTRLTGENYQMLSCLKAPDNELADSISEISRLKSKFLNLEKHKDDKIVELEKLKDSKILELEKDNVRLDELNKSYLHMLRKNPPERPGVSMKRKLGMMLRQQGKCDDCSAVLNEDNYDVDHRVRWCETFNNCDSNLHILCLECHRKKTRLEAKTLS